MRLLVALAAIVAATIADDTYVVVAPTKIRPGLLYTVSVNILRANGSVNVIASIASNDMDVVSNHGTFQQGTPGQIHIQLPKNLARSSYQLRVRGSGGLTFDNKTYVTFESKQMSILIQTDKAMYKPGDTVNFRVLAIYPDLKPYNGPMDIFISDAGSNKIRQFIGETGHNGVVTKSLSLSTQPVLGDWKIQVNAKDESESKVFTIDEYVLPKFEVDVIMPSYVVATDTTVSFTVKAKYTYGKPVKGKLHVAAKMHYSYQDYGTSTYLPFFNTEMDIDGEATVSFPMSDALKISSYINGKLFSVQANVTESLTGNTLLGSGTVKVYNTGSKLEFPASNPDTFKPGLRYTAYLKVSQQDGVPVALSNKQVTINVRVTSLIDLRTTTQPPNNPLWTLPTTQAPNIYWWTPPSTETKNQPERTFPVPVNGLVLVPIDIPPNAKDIYVTARYDSATQSKSISKSYSPSKSYMQLSLTSGSNIMAGNSFNIGVKATQPLGQMVYQILSRGQIVHVGTVDGHDQTYVSFSVTTTSSMAPNARIVVYYVRQDGEIVTDSISFDVSGVFKNKVGISINQTEAEPGESVKVTVTADPFSDAHLLAVDQSVLLLKSGNDITADDVYSELKSYDSISSHSNDNFGPFGGGIRGKRRAKRMIWWPYPVYYGGSDATAIFKNAGVIVLTDALVFKHKEPIPYSRHFFLGGGFGFGIRPMNRVLPTSPKIRPTPVSSVYDEPDRVRKVFPETWLWSNIDICSNGKAELVTSVPDTITSWVATAFAVHPDSGLGVVPTAAKFKVFRPFFISLNLPYSVVRGEHVILQAIVYNYMSTDQQVKVTLGQSNSFFNIKVDGYGQVSNSQGDAIQNIMVKAGEVKSVKFPIMPAALGKIDLFVKAQSTQAADALRRQLLVEPEGVPKEYNIPVLIEVQNSQFVKTIDLSLPPNTVTGSELVKVSVIGDIMGPSISGIDNLLRMPTGCGEQTMLGLAPDVYITNYLTATNQLTGDIKNKALGYMEKGYQRELTYKHTDGSFSAFGKNDKSGSMWLTAFVAKVFHEAKPYIFVDEKVIKTSISWMIRHQSSNGSFPEPGRVIHKNMQGMAGSGASLTCFVLISLLENQDLYTDNSADSQEFHAAKQLAQTYLETEVARTNDLYLMAMASYAFQLAGSSSTDPLLTRLDQLADRSGGLYHLHQVATKKATKGTWHSPNPTSAVDTEMTSYVLSTYALRQDIAFGRKMMQWVTQQRNSNGGFSSTQDTVVALKALSMMAKQLYSKNFNLNIDVTMDSSPRYSFQVNSNNAVIMQRRETKTVPAKVQIDASGSGTALVEVAVFFNVESEVEDTTFDLNVILVEETMNKLVIKTCTSWLGDGDASGMAVQEIGIPSGFTADLESFDEIPTLKRKEPQDKKVILYFDEIGRQPVCLKFVAARTGLVAKSQPAAVRVYDYYEPSNQVTGFYQSQILKDANICDVCTDCENCAVSPHIQIRGQDMEYKYDASEFDRYI